MFMRVADLIFLFLIWLRFPHSKSVAEVIRKRYRRNTVKKFRKSEKLDYRLRKAQIDLEFLVSCSNNSVVPKFLNFRVASKSLKSSRKREFDLLHSALQTEASFIDFARVRSLFLGYNDKVSKHKITIQQKKFNNLKYKKPEHDPKKIIFNYSSYVLSEAERSVLF